MWLPSLQGKLGKQASEFSPLIYKEGGKGESVVKVRMIMALTAVHRASLGNSRSSPSYTAVYRASSGVVGLPHPTQQSTERAQKVVGLPHPTLAIEKASPHREGLRNPGLTHPDITHGGLRKRGEFQ